MPEPKRSIRFENLQQVQAAIYQLEDLQQDVDSYSDDVRALLMVLVEQTKRLGRMIDGERVSA